MGAWSPSWRSGRSATWACFYFIRVADRFPRRSRRSLISYDAGRAGRILFAPSEQTIRTFENYQRAQTELSLVRHQPMETDMRNIVLTTATILLLATGMAHAQSGQGGYLGKNPGADLPAASTDVPPIHGSGQGGYLGENPG